MRKTVTCLCLAHLCGVTASPAASGLFADAAERAAFDAALAEQDARYDPDERMIQRPFSSPGYHTTLAGGMVHPTRDSLRYAVALYDSGEPERIARAQAVVRRVVRLQDQDPRSRTYGIWSWFLEEPLDRMSPPDWNWADFLGAQLLQIALEHDGQLAADLRAEIKASILHACRSIMRRDVKPGYTNIALMGAYVTLAAGDLYQDAAVLAYGRMALRRFDDYTQAKGSFSEYNSPTYSLVAIQEISRMLRHVHRPADRDLVERLNRLAWRHVARHFHVPTKQWAGPHSRCYRTLLRDSSLAALERGTGGHAHLLAAGKGTASLDAHRLRLHCPEDLLPRFQRLDGPRMEVETFVREAFAFDAAAASLPDLAAPGRERTNLVGATWLTPSFCLGSVNVGDLWNQRRPLLAYWNTTAGPASLRLRCLHDGYDYSSASVFTVQDRGDVLAAVVFATDRGDTHISLDRIQGRIQARELGVWLECEGAGPQDLPALRPGPTGILRLASGTLRCEAAVAYAAFGNEPVTAARRPGATGLRLYQGPRREIDFTQLPQAAVVLALSLRGQTGGQQPDVRGLSVTRQGGTLVTRWQRPGAAPMLLVVPERPAKTQEQRSRTWARLGGCDPWQGD